MNMGRQQIMCLFPSDRNTLGAALRGERGGVVLPLITLIVVFAAGILVGDSDVFQRYAFPKRYWSEQVRSLQENLVKYKKMAHDDAVLLKQAELKAKLAVAQEIYDRRYAQEIIDTHQETIDEAENEIEAMYIKDVKETLSYLNELISQTKMRLAEAKQELASRP
jgi:hypothetical protein